MILNIGDSKYIKTKDIIAIINKDSIKNSNISIDFLSKRLKNPEFKDPDIKSYILTNKLDDVQVHTSKISSITLMKRNERKKWR